MADTMVAAFGSFMMKNSTGYRSACILIRFTQYCFDSFRILNQGG
jgi:hypothetical protein